MTQICKQSSFHCAVRMQMKYTCTVYADVEAAMCRNSFAVFYIFMMYKLYAYINVVHIKILKVSMNESDVDFVGQPHSHE